MQLLSLHSSLSLLPNALHLQSHSLTSPRTSITSNFIKKTPFNPSLYYKRTFHPPHSTVVEESAETSSNDESEFVEIGYVFNVFGIDGELRVKPNTDFPELRFSTPGRRWLKERFSGKESIREVELVEGRDHPGQKSWIVSFNGVDTVEEAKQLIGSTLLVREEDRPLLEEGEFYTRDLVGMRVILKETAQPVGSVINVYNSGASDLLEVMLDSAQKTHDDTDSSKSGATISSHIVLVPFVEAIVPDVNMNRREMYITPPKGLLELNLRSEEKSKKERRKLEWQQRKKATRRLIAAKKKFSEMEQKHIFHGLRFGDKAQKTLLADNIAGVNLKLFEHAIQKVEVLPKRWNLSESINAVLIKQLENCLEISREHVISGGTKDKPTAAEQLEQKGLQMISQGKVAMVLVADEKAQYGGTDSELGESLIYGNSSSISCLQALLLDEKRFLNAVEEDRVSSPPLVIVSPHHQIQYLQKLFLDYDYFTFDKEKVWLLEEEKLPVISSSLNGKNTHKVLMKSPWEILQSPVGSGGVLSLLSSQGILDSLSESGVEYLQVCSLGHNSFIGSALFSGFVDFHKADIGIKTFNNKEIRDEEFDMMFSVSYLKKMIDKLKLHAITEQNSHVEIVDDEWVDVVPTSPNSYELHCSIYSSLKCCHSDKMCMMEVSG